MKNKMDSALWERMLRKRRIDTASGCWMWCGSKSSNAGRPKAKQYGEVWVHHKLMRVHRVTAALQLSFDLDPNKCVCHTCDVPLCFNPAHLFIGTRAENNKDKSRKGRSSYGAKSNKTELSEEKLVAIFIERHINGKGVREIGRLFKMPHTTISNLLLGKRWPHITKILIKDYENASVLRQHEDAGDGI